MDTATQPNPPAAYRAGLAYALAAMFAWGILPIYFKSLKTVNPFELLSHRVLWAAPLLAGMVAWRGKWAGVWAALRSRRTLLTLLLTTLLIGGNWLGFIYSVVSGQLMEASLGYFISPLINVLLGRVFLGERQDRVRVLCVLLALAAIVFQTLALGKFPVLAIFLAISFAAYAFTRKSAPVEALTGLLVETLLLSLPALVYLALEFARQRSTFGHAPLRTSLYLTLAGVLTCLPLLWYTKGARLLPLSTIGLLQYVSPCLQFLTAWLLFHEPLAQEQVISMVLIWIALAIFTLHGIWQIRRTQAVAELQAASSE